MPAKQHVPKSTSAPDMCVEPEQKPAPACYEAPGGGNAMQLGALAGGMDEGERATKAGDTDYGADLSKLDVFDRITAENDRLLAHLELADRFDVVGDDFVGPRLPNQVTAEEYDRIATMYSDIRTGRTQIGFDASGSGMSDDDFRNAVMGDFGDILTTQQGRDLLDQMAYQEVDGDNHTTTIGWSANPAAAAANIGPGGNIADAVNGQGTNVGVNYQPGVDFDLGDHDAGYANDDYAEFSSDTVLFHELIHANHGRLGLIDGEMGPAGFHRPAIEDHEAAIHRDRGVAREEYETVGIGDYGGEHTENGYRQERALVTGTAVPERGNYAGSGP